MEDTIIPTSDEKPKLLQKIIAGIKWFFVKVYSIIKWIFVEGFLLVKWILIKSFRFLLWIAKKISIFLKKLLIVLVVPPFILLKFLYKVIKYTLLKIWTVLKWFFTEDKITRALSIFLRIKLAYRSLKSAENTNSERAMGVFKALFTLSGINEVIEEDTQ